MPTAENPSVLQALQGVGLLSDSSKNSKNSNSGGSKFAVPQIQGSPYTSNNTSTTTNTTTKNVNGKTAEDPDASKSDATAGASPQLSGIDISTVPKDFNRQLQPPSVGGKENIEMTSNLGTFVLTYQLVCHPSLDQRERER